MVDSAKAPPRSGVAFQRSATEGGAAAHAILIDCNAAVVAQPSSGTDDIDAARGARLNATARRVA